MTQDSDSIMALINDGIKKTERDIGKITVLIAGHTNVGKSTLINEIFHGNFATAGQGKPVAKETREYTKKGHPLTIIDSRGLELKEHQEIIEDLMKYVELRRNETDINRHIHVSWICISEDGRRVKDAEINLHERLAEFVPVLGVITKARSDQGFISEVQCLLRKTKNVIRVQALRDQQDDGHQVQPRGLENLVEATVEVIPEAVQGAFVATQKVSIEEKKKVAHKVVEASAVAASDSIPSRIPFSDATALVPIQIEMLISISAIFGIEFSNNFFYTLITHIFGTTQASSLGSNIASNLLESIPGVGITTRFLRIAPICTATIAAHLTSTLGKLYIEGLSKLDYKGAITPEAIAQAFKKLLPGMS